MSHTVTVRTATVTTSTSSILINTGFLKTSRGILKFLELILGIVCVGISGHLADYRGRYYVADLFLLLMVTTFMICTFTLVLSCLFSISTESMISKTLFEIVYHAIGFALLLAASINYMVFVNDQRKRTNDYELEIALASIGLVNSVLYLFSTIMGSRSYRGI